MSTITSEQFAEICNDVWRDRAALLSDRGFLTAEAALVRAVYWRLCKAGVQPKKSIENYSSDQTVLTYELVIECVLELSANPRFKSAPFINELVVRYQNEVGDLRNKEHSNSKSRTASVSD